MISVIIPAYNKESAIVGTVDACVHTLAQLGGPRIERSHHLVRAGENPLPLHDRPSDQLRHCTDLELRRSEVSAVSLTTQRVTIARDGEY
jgi:hypothetical protein